MKGDRKAQMHLYSTYYKRVYNSCYRILQNPQDAEDAMQESFMKVFSRLNLYREDTPLEAWLLKIAVNTSIDKLRENTPVFMEIREELSREVETPDESDDREVIRKRADEVRRAIGKLPSKYQLVLNLNLLEGLDFEEIAEVLQLKAGTVRIQFLRGKEKLKEIIQKTKIYG